MKSPKDLFPVDDGGTDRHIADLFINRNRRSLFADFLPAAGLEPQIGFGVALIATGDAGFLHRNGQLSANRLQKKFEDPKMVGEFFFATI